MGTAIDLVAAIEEIAGDEERKGSDEKFRLYVKLTPDAVSKQELIREFQHGEDNRLWKIGILSGNSLTPVQPKRQRQAPTTMLVAMY